MKIINGEIKEYCCSYLKGYIDLKDIIKVDKNFKELVYDGDIFFTINYCPFCGKKVEYIESDITSEIKTPIEEIKLKQDDWHPSDIEED
jgi:hypothetical protein